MYSIIVVPPPTTEDEQNRPQIRLAPGERLGFGRVSRRAGEITARAPSGC